MSCHVSYLNTFLTGILHMWPHLYLGKCIRTVHSDTQKGSINLQQERAHASPLPIYATTVRWTKVLGKYPVITETFWTNAHSFNAMSSVYWDKYEDLVVVDLIWKPSKHHCCSHCCMVTSPYKLKMPIIRTEANYFNQAAIDKNVGSGSSNPDA